MDPPVADLPSLPLEAAAPTDLAGDAHVWQEAHLQSLHPLALTGGAAPARGVEGETGGSLVPGARAAGNQRRAAYPAARHRDAPVSGQRRQLPRAPRRGELHSPLRFLPQPPRPLPLRRHRRGVRAGRGCRRCSRSCPLFGGLVAGPVLPAADRFNPCRGGQASPPSSVECPLPTGRRGPLRRISLTAKRVYLAQEGLGWVAGLGRAKTSRPPPSVSHQNQ